MSDMKVALSIDRAQLLELLAQVVPEARESAMVRELGEACTKAQAARKISCSQQTITKLIEDGRIKAACEGTRVDVRSLAEYIDRRSEADHDARMSRKYKSYV